MAAGYASGRVQWQNCLLGAVHAVTQAVAVKFMAERKMAMRMVVRKVEEEMPRLWAVQCLILQNHCHHVGWQSNSPEIAQKP